MSAELRNLAIVLLVVVSIPVGALFGTHAALREIHAHEKPDPGVLMQIYWSAYGIGEGIRCSPYNTTSDQRGCPGPPGPPR